MGYVNTNTRSFTAGEAIPQYARVKLNTATGKIVVAGIADKDLGVAEQAGIADGDVIAVRLRTAAGTQKAIASEAITAGAPIYTAASGKVSDTAASTSFYLGEALETASDDGDIIEIVRAAHGDTAN